LAIFLVYQNGEKEINGLLLVVVLYTQNESLENFLILSSFLRKGKMEQIEVTVEKRMGNKKVSQ